MNIKIGHSDWSKSSALPLPISASKHGGQFLYEIFRIYSKDINPTSDSDKTRIDPYSPARNEQILNLANSSMKDIRIFYEGRKLHLRSKTTTENWAVSVYDEKLCLCVQTTLTCNVVRLACLVATTPLISMNWRSTIPCHRLPDE